MGTNYDRATIHRQLLGVLRDPSLDVTQKQVAKACNLTESVMSKFVKNQQLGQASLKRVGEWLEENDYLDEEDHEYGLAFEFLVSTMESALPILKSSRHSLRTKATQIRMLGQALSETESGVTSILERQN